MYVCMYVCMYICMYVCIYACMYVSIMCICLYIKRHHKNARMHAHTHINIRKDAHPWKHVESLNVDLFCAVIHHRLLHASCISASTRFRRENCMFFPESNEQILLKVTSLVEGRPTTNVCAANINEYT